MPESVIEKKDNTLLYVVAGLAVLGVVIWVVTRTKAADAAKGAADATTSAIDALGKATQASVAEASKTIAGAVAEAVKTAAKVAA
jgi:hypothetical protein